MHTNAKEKAIAGECAKLNGKFWQFHDQMYSSLNPMPLSYKTNKPLIELAKTTEANKKIAQKMVVADIKAGVALRIIGTPTFFLCKPDGSVLQLGDISAIDTAMNK